MKRSGFRPKPRPPRPEPVAYTLTVRPNYARCTVALPVPKREYVRSKALREAYRLIPCQHCGLDDGTVCCAHSNWGVHGKGKSIKADDSRGASLCSTCHVPLLDQGSQLSRAERQAMWWAAHVKSVTLMLERGLWPLAVPVPDLSTNPFTQEQPQ